MNQKEKKPSKKVVKKYPVEEQEDKPKEVVKEPAAIYGMPMQDLDLDETKRYTYADYLTWWDDKRRELMDGFIRMMSPAATFKHATLVSLIGYKIMSFIKRRKGECYVCYAPFDVRLPKNGEIDDNKIYTVLQPDICVICDLSKVDEKGCIGAPNLVVEVQSPSTSKYDLTEKFDAYEIAGVPEYWVVFPDTHAIKVFLLQENGKYDSGTTYQSEGKMPVQTLKGMKLDINDLFKNI